MELHAAHYYFSYLFRFLDDDQKMMIKLMINQPQITIDINISEARSERAEARRRRLHLKTMKSFRQRLFYSNKVTESL
jgi:hypothetical protein